jgi:DNA-binding transcriptional ArsR family regulator
VVIPEDKTYKPFNLLPNYLPDEIDMKLMSKLSQKIALTDLEEYLGIKQPTISMRLKRLEKHGYVILNGRNRELTDLGKMLVQINKPELSEKGGK